MCMHKKYYYKIIFWTSIAALILMTLIGISAIISVSKLKHVFDRYEDIFHEKYSFMIIMLLVCSVLITMVSMFSLVAVLLDWFPLLILSAPAMVIMSLISIIVGLWILVVSRALVKNYGLLRGIETTLQEMVAKPDFLALNNTILDPIQIDFECCGVKGYEDYSKSTSRKWMRDILPLPKSCCIDPASNCLPNTEEHHESGCLLKLALYSTETFNSYATTLVSFGITMGIIGMYIFLLAKKSKEHYYYYPYYF